MMKMKKLSAALLAVVMLVSMLSCVVLGVSAAGDLGGPISIGKVEAPSSGIPVSGVALDNGILVVDDDWGELMDGDRVNIKLGGKVYTAVLGINAFVDIGKAVAKAEADNTIYVAAGSYNGTVSLAGASNLKIYGPHAGVNPNAANVKDYNPARPAANVDDFAAVAADPDYYNEAIITGTINLNSVQYRPTNFLQLDGLYFADAANIYLATGSTYFIAPQLRNNIFSISSSYIMNMARGQNPGILLENNRVLKGKSLVTIGGMMNCTVKGNYLNLSPLGQQDSGMTEKMSAGAVYISSIANPSSGTSIRVENNYFKNCSGIVRQNRGTTGYQTANYSIQIFNNEIERVEPGTYLVENKYYSKHSLPGINVQFAGNTVHGISEDTVLFNMPYQESEFNLSRYRYIVNINDNTFDLPASSKANFINAEMAGVIDASGNTFTNGITMSQIAHADDCEVILYPYYNTSGEAVGGAIVKDVADMTLGGTTYTGNVDEAEKKITYDLTGADLDKIDLTALLQVDEGCTISVYKEKTLETKVKADAVYLDGQTTERSVVVTAPDGASSVYTLLVTREEGSKAELLEVVANSSDLLVKVSHPETTKFVIDHLSADLAFLTYDLNVSAGATVTLYDDYAAGKLMEDLGNYIPYGGYTIDVLVRSEDGTSEQVYTLEFNRAKSDLYDPSIVAVVSPKGQWSVRPYEELWVTYVTDGMRNELTFDLKATPGATYTVYSDKACTKKLYASDDIKPLALKAGVNIFYVKVTEGSVSNVVNFEVVNDTLNDDATITGIVGNQPQIINNEITMAVGGTTTSLTFSTADPFATCEVYADEACKLKIEGTTVETPDLYSDRVMKTTTFTLEIAHATNKYFVKCIAEDGVTTELYTLILTKMTNALTYVDVPAEAWYAPYVETATGAGILAGETVEAGQIFRPADNTTREEIAVIMARLTGINGTAYANVALGYKDEAKISDWALNYVKVCKQNGLMGGSAEADGVYFQPGKSITREQVMVIFARMLDLDDSYDLSSFADANKVSGWARKDVEAVVASGLIVGAEGKLNPQSPITRAEIAAIATRALDYID